MDAKGGQFTGLFGVLGLGVQLGKAFHGFVFLENFPLNFVGPNVGLRQEFFEAGKSSVVSIVVTFGRLDNTKVL